MTIEMDIEEYMSLWEKIGRAKAVADILKKGYAPSSGCVVEMLGYGTEEERDAGKPDGD